MDGRLGQASGSGKPRDAETGLDDFGARYYSGAGGGQSDFGRFVTPDWVAGAEAVPYAGLDNPQSLNLYAYALNNPVTRVDFDGHFVGPGQGTDGTDVTLDWAGAMSGYDFHGPPPAVPGMLEMHGAPRYIADDFNIDAKNHGRPHIDRTDKHGRLVGRYDENLDPIRFKGKMPPELSGKQRNSPEARAAQKRLRKLLKEWNPQGTSAGQGEPVRFSPAVVPFPMVPMPVPGALAPDPLPVFTGIPFFVPDPIFVF